MVVLQKWYFFLNLTETFSWGFYFCSVSKLSASLYFVILQEFWLQLKISCPPRMGPSCRRRTRSTRKSRRATICKKKNHELTDQETPSKVSNSPLNLDGIDFGMIDASNSPCATPKAEKFRIPEITTCPPAPKKRRVLKRCSSLRRNPIAFFAPPDLELFFFVSLRDFSAWRMSSTVINRVSRSWH